jgi:tetratricopeptide (TPR) repeat protein
MSASGPVLLQSYPGNRSHPPKDFESARGALERYSREVGQPARPEFVGRRKELGRLHQALREAAVGHGSLWSVTGVAGVGKTRLMTELGRLGARAGFEVRWGLSTWEGQSPLFPFLQLFRTQSADQQPSDTPLFRNKDPRAGRAPGSSPKSRAILRSPPPDHRALALIDEIEGASRVAPQLFLIDDFHRSDSDSVRFLNLLSRKVQSERILLVFSYRAESPLFKEPAPQVVNELVTRLRISGLLRAIDLTGLSEEETTQLARENLRTETSAIRWKAAVVSASVRLSGGNPFFLRELTALLNSSPRNWEGGRQDASDLPDRPSDEGDTALPTSIQDLLRQRMLGLPRSHRQVLGAAALMGESFCASDVASTFPSQEGTVLETLRLMGDVGWPVRRVGSLEGQYTFQHALLREASLALLLPSERRRLAGRIVRSWGRDHPDDLVSITRLYVESECPSRGLASVDQLIDEALNAHSYGSLERLLEWKSRILGPAPGARTQCLDSFMGVLRRVRPFASSDFLRLTRLFLTLHPTEPERTIVESWHIGCISSLDLPLAKKMLRQLQIRTRTSNDPATTRAQGHVAMCQLRILVGSCDYDSALPLARQLCHRWEAEGSSLELLLATLYMAISLYALGRASESLPWVQRGQDLVRAGGLAESAAALSLLDLEAFWQHNSGKFSRSAEIYEPLVDRLSDLGSFERAAQSGLGLAASRLMLDDVGGSRQAAEAALLLSRRWGLPGMEGGSYTTLGHCCLAENRPDTALGYFRRALPLLPSSSGTRMLEFSTRTGLARVYIARGEMDEADEQLRILESLESRRLFWVLGETERVRALWIARTGDVPGALRVLRQSLSRQHLAPCAPVRAEIMATMVHLYRLSGDPRRARAWGERCRRELAVGGVELVAERVMASVTRELEYLVSRHVPEAREARGHSKLSTLHPEGPTSKRIIRTLTRIGARSGGLLDRETLPRTFTQAGLSSELGIPRASFVRTLIRLVDRGAVVQVRRRIQGSTRIQKAYLVAQVTDAHRPEI